jgi:RNA polymerase sigma-70 factor (ECF subfamily)
MKQPSQRKQRKQRSQRKQRKQSMTCAKTKPGKRPQAQKPPSPPPVPAYQDLPDLQLLDAVLGQDELAWKELIRRFRGLIFRCITKVLCKYESVLSNEDVNEIFSEVCFNLVRNDMKKLRAYDPKRGCKLGSWIGLISINTSYDHLRVTARQPMLDRIEGIIEREDQTPDPLDNLLEKERWIRLNDLASDFSDKDQRFLELYYGRGMKPSEVARIMKISVKTVYSKKNKIRNKLVAMALESRPEAMAA